MSEERSPEYNDAPPEIEEGAITGSSYIPLTDEAVKKLAKELYRNEVFFSFQIHQNHRQQMLMSVFMVLIFADPITLKQWQTDEIDVFYEYYSEAGPRSINGYPCFFSCRVMTRADGQRVLDEYNKIRELLGDNNG
jgi:hypothetical protein